MKTFSFTLFCMSVFGPAYAEYITGNLFGDIFYISEDTIIASDSSIKFNTINVTDSLYLQNHGRIFGDINTCDNCRVYLRNSGTIYGDIHVGTNASLIQVVTSTDDIGVLNVWAPHELLIYRASAIEWDDVIENAYNVNTITIADSVIYLSSGLRLASRAAIPSIELIGENEIHLKRDDIVNDMPLFRNVSGDGKITLYVDDMNPLYVAHAVIRDGDMYTNIVRETDYLKILGGNTGTFLNALRAQNPSDNLLCKLDAAPDMSGLKHILDKSMRINTHRLNQPLKTLSRHIRTTNIGQYPFQVQPFVIFGSNISAYGAHTGINVQPNANLRLSVNTYAATMSFTDGIDNFSGDVIGINIAAQYNNDKIYTHMKIGASQAYMETPTLKTHNSTVQNPHGRDAYADIDIGCRFEVNRHLAFIPFVGISGEYARVLNTDYDSAALIGFATEYKHKATELIYAYGIRMTTNTLNVNFIDAHIDVISLDDSFTFRSALGRLRDEMGVSYSITASAVFEF